MDPIKEHLIRKKFPKRKQHIPKIEPQSKDFNLRDQLLKDIYLKNISVGDLGNNDKKKVLIMANLYAANNESSNISKYYNCKPSSWAVFLSYSLENNVMGVINSVYKHHQLMTKKIQEQIAEDVISQYLTLDFSAYQKFVPSRQQGYFVVIDQLFQTEPSFDKIRDMRSMFRNKKHYLNQVLEENNINIKNLDSLYALDKI